MPSSDLDVSNLVLRTVYLDPGVDEALRLQAFAGKTSNTRLLNRYLSTGLAVHGYPLPIVGREMPPAGLPRTLQRFNQLSERLLASPNNGRRESLLREYIAHEQLVIVNEFTTQHPPTMTPTLFLDLTDVISVGGPYGGYDLMAPDRPDDLFERLFHRPAVEILTGLLVQFAPAIVLTSDWTRFMGRATLVEAFDASGLPLVSRLLHEEWCIYQPTGVSRAAAIAEWLAWHHSGEPIAILDDPYSGTGLSGSGLDADKRVVLCEVGVGLTAQQERAVELAFSRPYAAPPSPPYLHPEPPAP